MNPLSLNLDDLSFDELVAAAQARLPALAPAWTDYNLHDPGITLVDLMAWSTEAQIYALARMRRDERQAYGRLVATTPGALSAGAALTGAGAASPGPQPAGGRIWPDEDAAGWVLASLPASASFGPGEALRPSDADLPRFESSLPVRLFRHRMTALTTRCEGGRRVDLLETNRNGRLAFAPFGPQAGPADHLRLALECADPAALGASGPGLLCVGIRVAEDVASHPEAPAVVLQVRLLASGLELLLPVVHDDTGGWTRSGVIALQLPPGLPEMRSLALDIRAVRGFHVPPHVRRIGLCVLPVRQVERVVDSSSSGTGWPDQAITLERRPIGLAGAPALPELRVNGVVWQLVDDLAAAGPADAVFRYDVEAGQVVLGNGVNGRIPAPGAALRLAYVCTDGAAGNQFRTRTWTAIGLATFGRNLDPLTGGLDTQDASAQRSLARQQALTLQTLVTAADVAAAAMARQDLRVGRAEVVDSASDAGLITLLLLRRPRPDEDTAEPQPTLETPRWLATVRGLLQPRLPLGVRLRVRGPDYLDIAVQARLRIDPLQMPRQVQARVETELQRRLAAIAIDRGQAPRPLGLALSATDLQAWLRRVEGVLRVELLVLLDSQGRAVDTVDPGRWGLPRLRPGALTIDLVRGTGSLA